MHVGQFVDAASNKKQPQHFDLRLFLSTTTRF